MMFRFIKNVLIPERVDTYYVIPQTVLGLDIGKTAVHGVLLFYSGKSITVKKVESALIDTDLAMPYPERAADAIRKIIERVGDYDILRVSLPSAMTALKELSFPFSDAAKIESALPLEIEQSLPFPISKAVFGWIPIQKEKTRAETTILVAAATNETIATQLLPLYQAGLQTNALTVDIFDLFALFKQLKKEYIAASSVVLLDIDTHVTRIAYIQNEKLVAARSVPKGLTTIAKMLAQTIDMMPAQALETFMRFGCQESGKPGYCEAIQTTLEEFFKEIRLTLENLFVQYNEQKEAVVVLLMGQGAEPADMVNKVKQLLEVPVQLLDIAHISEHSAIKTAAGVTVDQASILALATALVTKETEHLNLNISGMEEAGLELLSRQTTMAFILLFCVGTLLGFHFWNQTKQLRNAIRSAESSAVSALREEELANKKNLREAISQAEEAVQNQEAIWFSFSDQTRFSFLKYLEGLSVAIDRSGLGLRLQRLSINQRENNITLTGEVRDFEALKLLEKNLEETGMFTHIPNLQNTKFNVSIVLKKVNQD